VTEDLHDPERLEWEKSLHSRALAGERPAFAALYEAYAQALYLRVLMPKLGQAAAAQDALAETFRVAFEKLDSFEPRGTSIYFWLARIAANKALDMHRARAMTGRAIVDIEAHFYGLGEREAGADKQLEVHERLERCRPRLTLCLAALNERYRQAIELRFMQEHDRDTCAELMGISSATFDVVLLRALRSVHKHWEQLVQDAKEPTSERY
jgi:RNA polymerase sigma factor (sigma-70 family)